jgi:FkbM family methyltransferase
VRDKLYRNISLNQGKIAPIEIFTYGLGAEEALYSLSEDLGYGLGNASLSKAIEYSKETGDIKVRTLDSFCFESVDFIKIDVEGMEYDVLRGSTETLMRCRPIVLFETLTRQSPEIHKKSEEFLRERGYLCYYLDVKKSALVQATYPHYPQEDTIAIPSEKISDIAC